MAKNLFAKAASAGGVGRRPIWPSGSNGFCWSRRLAISAGRAGPARAVAGFVKVEQMIGRQRAGLLIVADGSRTAMDWASSARSGLPIARLGDAAALGGIFGREQTVYVAVRPRRCGR